MSGRGRRARVEEGIFRDAIGLAAVVKVGRAQRERRYPLGTDLRTLRDWRRATRAALELGIAQPDPAAPVTTLAADIDTYLALLPVGTYRDDLQMLLGHWRRAVGGRERQALTAQVVQAQLLAWRRDGAAASTCNHRRRALIALYRTLDGPQAPNPAAATPKLPEPRREPRGLPWPIVRRILAALPDRGRPTKGKARPEVSLTRARLWVLGTTGWPHAVLARLEPRDLHLDGPEPHAVIRPRRKGRGARARTVPLQPDAVRALRRWVAVGARGAFSDSSMHSTFQRAVRRARARWEAAEARLAKYQRRRPRPWPAPDRIRVYDLRHSFGVRAILASDGNVIGTRELMLHESIATTMQYLEAASQASARAVVAAMAGTKAGTTAKPRGSRR